MTPPRFSLPLLGNWVSRVGTAAMLPAMLHTVHGGDASPSTVASVCPFLIATTGEWRRSVPDRDHRCGAFVPLTMLAVEKQARLCLKAGHVDCQTYQASLEARAARTGGSAVPVRAGRWGLARTAPVIVDVGGVRSRVIGAVGDRRRWPAVPALLLVATVLAVAISGMRAETPVTAIGTPNASSARATPAPASPSATLPAGSALPSPAPSSAPTVAPTVAPTALPSTAPAFRQKYTVKSGDTLSKIANQFQTTVSAIAGLNNITDPARLKVGQVLLIP